MTPPERRRRALLAALTMTSMAAAAVGTVVLSSRQPVLQSASPAPIPAASPVVTPAALTPAASDTAAPAPPTSAPTTPAPASGAPATATDDDGADGPAPTDPVQGAQAKLVTAEDNRIYGLVGDLKSKGPPYQTPAIAPSVVPTVVLPPRPRPYDLTSLQQLGAAKRLPDGTWMLLSSVLVGRGAELRIVAPGATLRMASGTAGFTSIVAFKGTVTLSGAPEAPFTITSWDPVTGTPDTTLTDGRSYLRGIGSRMNLTQVHVTDVGFRSGRTGGVAWTGNATASSSGGATATTVERSHYGMFISRAEGIVVDGGAVRDNESDGVLLHRGATGIALRNLESSGNGGNGVTMSSGTQQITLTAVTARHNAGVGIDVDGSALADRASAGGVNTEPGHDFTIENCVVADNRDAGISASDAEGLRLHENTVSGSPDGIVAHGAVGGVDMRGNTIDALDFGIAVRDGVKDAAVTANNVRTATIAVQIADASADLHDNVIGGASHYAVSLTGKVGGSAVVSNKLAGRGPSAIDTNRVAEGEVVNLGANDDTGWVVDRDGVAYWSKYVADHPLLLLWLLILLLPLGAGLWTRRHRRATAAAAARRAEAEQAESAEPERGDVESTVMMPVTRVTIVSGAGARK